MNVAHTAAGQTDLVLTLVCFDGNFYFEVVMEHFGRYFLLFIGERQELLQVFVITIIFGQTKYILLGGAYGSFEGTSFITGCPTL